MESPDLTGQFRPDAAARDDALCELRGIRKAFSHVRALDGVDLTVRPGEIHAVVGENGAGKTTLLRILGGSLAPDEGDIVLGGRATMLRSPRDALSHGIAVVHQDPALFSWRSVEENCFNLLRLPGKAWISWRRVRAEARDALRRVGLTVDPWEPAGTLGPARRQLLGIAGALLASPTILVLDEPTASLGVAESHRLFGILHHLRARGVGVVYVSHRISEVLDLADRVTVLRDGRRVLCVARAEIDAGALVEAMVGRRLEARLPRPPTPRDSEVVLECSGLEDEEGAFHDVGLALRRGEVLGVYGLVGAGRSELGQALASLRRTSGTLRVRGRIAYVPEDRLRHGNLTGLGLRENVTIASLRAHERHLLVRRGLELRTVSSACGRLGIRASGPEQRIETLSGGNQQKALLGRWLTTDPDILVLDEPTQGIDVGAREEIHRAIAELAVSRRAILLISSDLPEVLGMSHRILVLREGRVSATLGSSPTEDEVGRAALPEARDLESRGSVGEGARRRARLLMPQLAREAGLLAAIAAILIASGIRSPEFLSPASLLDVATNGAPLATSALGMAVVIATGGIDVSVGSMLALCAAAATLLGEAGWGPGTCLAAASLLGGALGALNAGVSLVGRLHPLIVTLGALGIFRGAFLLWTGGNWLSLHPRLLALASEGPLGIPITVHGTLLSALSVFAFLRWTRTGRASLEVGDNPEAARVHGLPIGRARASAFAILGASVGLSAVFTTARFGKVQNNTGEGFELQVIAAAVLGGAHVAGGRGSVVGALLGAALISLLSDARSVWGIHERWQLVIVGGLMLGAVGMERVLAGISRRGS